MGISSMPTPSEGMMTLLVMNTVFTISIFKQILSSALRFLGIRTSAAAAVMYCEPSEAEQFRSRFKPVRYGAAVGLRRPADDCRVCLSRFEADSAVNRLGCGHIFHRECMEKWLEYQYHHLSCPLCRTFVLLGKSSTTPPAAPPPLVPASRDAGEHTVATRYWF